MATAPTFQSFLKKKRHKFNKWNQVCSVVKKASLAVHTIDTHIIAHTHNLIMQRWFVLRGNILSWYTQKNDATAAGSTRIEAGSWVSTTLVSFDNLLYISS